MLMIYIDSEGIKEGDIKTGGILGDTGRFMQLTIDWYVNDEMKGLLWQ